ncbi:uncharacterized protein LOC120082778 [Benincasa hispida]|uniref:uncharacterized protein LOC120082778 n=1 Tax=Benincasa hispida TaxID=102211 RepID=UPI0018FF4438|nr:uncharacterized protein LOC120082778 [Benincasa hispida]
MSVVPRRRSTSTRIHILALDGIVNVNSLFTFAVFLGVAWYPTANPAANLLTDDDDGPCAAADSVAQSLIACNVYSFSCFLFSSLVASALKQAIRNINGGDGGQGVAHAPALRVGMVASAVGSVLGCGFLVAALLNLVQIKLGTFDCRRWETVAAAVPLGIRFWRQLKAEEMKMRVGTGHVIPVVPMEGLHMTL